MAVKWEEVRYRGDVEDVQELFESYRVGDYLETYEENRRQQDYGLREQLLKNGIRLSEGLAPRAFALASELVRNLEIETAVEIFCLPDPEINAFALLEVREQKTHSILGITSGALERLDDGELRSILGHELGHFLFGNNRMNALIVHDPENPATTVLPTLGESLFLRWRKKAEISADRVGLLGSRSFEDSATSLLKATFGLSERNLNLNVEGLLAQVDEIKGRPELMDEAFASHPLLPIRLKALELFSRSDKARRAGFDVSAAPLNDDDLEDAVDELMQLTRRYPHKPLTEAVMRTIALGGALLLGADGDVNAEEVKILIQVLHRFTDQPEDVIVTDQDEVSDQLPRVVETVCKEGDDRDKTFIMSRLADVALADGALMDEEGAVILQIGGLLGLPTKMSYAIMVEAAQTVGFKKDVKLNRIAEEIRRTLRIGFAPGTRLSTT